MERNFMTTYGTSMEASARLRSAGLHALAFLLFMGALWTLAEATQPFGHLVQAAMFFSSPLTYLGLLLPRGLLVGPSVLAFPVACLAPYFIYGAVIGYCLPVAPGQPLQHLRIAMVRLGLVVASFLIPGVLFLLWALAHDS